ncbi:centromere protein O [Suncus etruscus]|uniref:centromere protein O n=1 Tax=Suncus etruscus TaxID=109475 RepID=UPI00210F2393|nr:centromere protein O [Suncus etruscus]
MGPVSVLAHLERLETQMNESRRKLKEQDEELDLKTRIKKMTLLRDKLRAEVKQRRSKVRATLTGVEPHQTLEQEALERKRKLLKAILQAYRFTGLSGKLTSRGVCICISTAFEGNLLESYFVDIVIQKPLRIHHHSVPAWIPLEALSAKYLQTNIRLFLFRLHELLNAYSRRKYQADQLQNDFSAFLAGPLQRNSLCNLLVFTYKVGPESPSLFCARLMYKDLTASLPTAVTITQVGNVLSPTGEQQRAAHESLFQTQPLHRVFATFTREATCEHDLLEVSRDTLK